MLNRFILPVLLMILALSFSPTPGKAQETAANPPLAESPILDHPPVSLLTMSNKQAMKLSPRNREIRDLLVKERDDLSGLSSQLKTLTDTMEALALQREIADLKASTEIAILEVQARYARADGRVGQAEEIEAIVGRMKARHGQRNAEPMEMK